MIQTPICTPVYSCLSGNMYYPSQPMISNQNNTFYPVQPTNINEQLNEIHKIYYPDLTQEEFNASNDLRNEMLYKSGKLEQLAKYGTYTNCGLIYNKVKDNNDFKELINSKYFNNPQGFVKIINNLNNLEIQRQQKLTYYSPIYGINVQKMPTINYQKYDINDYLRMLNNFAKNNKLSDDLKQYILYKESDKLDLYYTTLDNIENNPNPMSVLLQ